MEGEYKDPLHIITPMTTNYINIKREFDTETLTNEPISIPVNIVVKEEELDLGEDTFILNQEDDSERFLCDQCGFVASSESMMARHKNHHVTFQANHFKCNHCPYETGYKGDLNVHVSKEHSTEIIIQPSPPKNNVKASGVEKDINKNSCVKQYQRRENFTFKTTNVKNLTTNASKKNHFWSPRESPLFHSPSFASKIYKCSKCAFKNSYKKIVLIHMNQHHLLKTIETVKWFKCGLCSFKSDSEYIVRAHFSTFHLNNSSKSSKQ